MTETRERGGFTQFEMQFAEAGVAVSFLDAPTNTRATVSLAADSAVRQALSLLPKDI